MPIEPQDTRARAKPCTTSCVRERFDEVEQILPTVLDEAWTRP